jgi:hypothetical protein
MTALAEFAERKLLPPEYLARRHVSDEPGGGIRFEYGVDARARIRKTAESAHPTFWARGDTRSMRILGHQLAGRFANRSDKTLLIVEGESDALTLWFHRRPALGVPGSTMAHILTREDVAWANRAMIIREPGDAGEKFVQLVAKRLRDVGFTGEIFEVSLAPYKDASELHIAAEGDRERFAAALDAAIATASPVLVEQPALGGELLSAADLLDSQEEHIDYLIDGLLPKGGIMLLVGKPKCGKSVAARNLALAVCRGSSFLGRATQQAPVLWLCLEETKGAANGRSVIWACSVTTRSISSAGT